MHHKEASPSTVTVARLSPMLISSYFFVGGNLPVLRARFVTQGIQLVPGKIPMHALL
jgi:hypothetical protein